LPGIAEDRYLVIIDKIASMVRRNIRDGSGLGGQKNAVVAIPA